LEQQGRAAAKAERRDSSEESRNAKIASSAANMPVKKGFQEHKTSAEKETTGMLAPYMYTIRR
jgi:hypothetical protein